MSSPSGLAVEQESGSTLAVDDIVPVLNSRRFERHKARLPMELMHGGMGFIQPEDTPITNLDEKVARTAVSGAEEVLARIHEPPRQDSGVSAALQK
jgi:hypothetical protein